MVDLFVGGVEGFSACLTEGPLLKPGSLFNRRCAV
jgi:hypothetical protein